MKNLICTLANNLVSKHGMNRSEAFKLAWAKVKELGADNLSTITFFSIKDKKEVKRVISTNWTAFETPKGGAPKPEQFICADIAKVIAREQGKKIWSTVIGPKKENVIKISAA